MTSVIAITPKEGSADDVKQLIVDSRADGIEGLEKYSIVLTREEQLLVINEWVSLDAFMDYVNGPHNMIELIEHLCDRYDEENVCKAYSGTVIHEEIAKYRIKPCFCLTPSATHSKTSISVEPGCLV